VIRLCGRVPCPAAKKQRISRNRPVFAKIGPEKHP
jgi:hypothetical protein